MPHRVTCGSFYFHRLARATEQKAISAGRLSLFLLITYSSVSDQAQVLQILGFQTDDRSLRCKHNKCDLKSLHLLASIDLVKWFLS